METSAFLPQMLESIQTQTHKDLEIIILDNQSTDNTAQFCLDLSKKDSRIQVLIDDQRRSPEEAMNKLTPLATGEFVITLGDDDYIDPYYIEKLVNILESNPDINMAYSNGKYLNVNNQLSEMSLIQNNADAYNGDVYYKNFCKAIHRRLVLPVVFGVFRTAAYAKLKPCEPFDVLQANMDNYAIAKFFLQRNTAAFLNQNLFYYRQRSRTLNPEGIPGMPTDPILIWVYYLRHQLYFYNAINTLINETQPNNLQLALSGTTLDSCLNQCWNLLLWVQRDLLKNTSEQSILTEIAKQYTYIIESRLMQMRVPMFYEEIENLRVRCKVIRERVLLYIESIVPDSLIVTETTALLYQIIKDLFSQFDRENHSQQLG